MLTTRAVGKQQPPSQTLHVHTIWRAGLAGDRDASVSGSLDASWHRARGAETAVIYRARGYGSGEIDFIQEEADLPAVWNLYNNRSCTAR